MNCSASTDWTLVMVWKNGQIPASDLVVFREGWDEDGYWYWALTPATLARHNALVARAEARTGRTLAPGYGYSTYRPLEPQRKARARYGNGAAIPGTSSHGGFWEGTETLAIDYSNWAWVYKNHGGRAAFYEDCAAVGLTPGMIEPRRGYPDEPWHVIDLNPRGPVPAFEDAKPFEEDDMFNDDDRALLREVRSRLRGPEDRKIDMLQSIEGLASETRNRLMVKDASGNEIYDVTQLAANELKPMLLTLIAAVGRPSSVPGAPIDVEALAAAIREGLPDAVADELAERLTRGRTA